MSERDGAGFVEALQAALKEGACDLHMHSNYSDGTDTPAELLTKVSAAGLKTFALTDHDTIEGVFLMREIINKLRSLGRSLPYFIPGVEISSSLAGREVHVLGYFPEGEIKKLEPFLTKQRQARVRRNRAICEKLQELGFAIRYEELRGESAHVLGKPHIAKLLQRKGYISTVQEAFDRFLDYGRPAHVPRDLPEVCESATRIRESGGIPVYAHPGDYGIDDVDLIRQHILEVKKCGILGVEVCHGGTDAKLWAPIAQIAREEKMLKTVGSDYHGKNKPRISLFSQEQDFSAYLNE